MDNSKFSFRFLLPRDEEQVCALVCAFAAESLCEYGVEVDPLKIADHFAAHYKTSIGMAYENKLVGVLGGAITEDSLGPGKVYVEYMWFVRKEFRRKGTSMLQYLQGFCQEHNIRRIVFSCMHNSKTEKLFRLYQRLGFTPMETKFVKILP